MSGPITVGVTQAEADALDTLFERMERAGQAFDAVQKRIAGNGKIQRIGPGSWVVTKEADG